MARVLLIKTRRLSFEQGALVPPLGAISVAAALRQAGHEVRVLDMLAGAPDPARALADFAPDVVGLSAITFEAGVLRDLARRLRTLAARLPLVVGGAHATAYPARCLDYPGVDHVVVGEGEQAMVELVEALAAGRPAAGIPGVWTRGGDGRIHQGPARDGPADLDALPPLAWDLLDVEAYARYRSMAPLGARRYLPIVTSRGCPYRCVYCHRVHGKRYRTRSPAHVVAEIEMLQARYGVTEIEIVDDNFNLDRARALAILEGIARLPFRVRISFPNALRADLLDREVIRALKRAGTIYSAFAVESALPRVQELMGKRLDIARVRRNIEIATREGIFVNGFFMLGFPTETLAEARETVRFAVDSALHAALFFTVTPFAGTELHERWQDLIRARGIGELEEDLEYYSARYNLSDMSDEDLAGLRREAYRRFYLSPRRLARILLAHPRRRALALQGILTLPKMVRGHTRRAE